MSPSPANLLVRANYLAIVVFGPLLAVLIAAFSLYAWQANLAIVLLTIILYVLPAIRAFRRLILQGTVIAPELVSERPVVSFVVTFIGSFGHFFFLITMAAGIGIALAPEWPEETKKIVGPLFVALLSYLIALWCGELALVGNGKSDEARSRSGPFC